jgi:alpha 1,3-glucosidase
VIPGSALVDGHLLVALVTNAANTSMRFNLTVIAYQDTVRIMMQEFPSLKVGRYEVQDVLMPGLDKRVRKMEGKTSAKYVIGTYDKIKVKLQQDPFRLEVLVDGKPAVTINSRDLFNFENRRAKQVGAELKCMHCGSKRSSSVHVKGNLGPSSGSGRRQHGSNSWWRWGAGRSVSHRQ